MTIQQRAEAFRAAFPQNMAAWPVVVQEQGRGVLYATWLIGNQYRATGAIYGSYPPGFLKRVDALFADELARLHVFSGSLPPGPYQRCDLVRDAEYRCSVYDLPLVALGADWDLVIADPPYSAEDAKRYGTPMVNRGKALRALAHVTAPGGHLVWLDTVWPMHRKSEWLTVGRITVVRSTNHRVRMVSIFERTAKR